LQQSTITIGTIGQLYSTLIGEPSPILLLGAGASLRSGIPLAGGVVERVARWAYRREHGWTEEHPLHRSDWVPWLEEKSWYNRSLDPADNYPYVVEHLLRPRQSRKEFFQHLLRPQVDPSPGYEKLVEFLHLGTIQTVLTTNFDSILPRMQAIKGRPHYLTSIQIPADLVKFSTSPPNPQLVYLHGSIEHYTDQNLVEEVQTLNPQLVERLLPLLRDHPLIVVGYRGAEASVMQHLLAQNTPATNNFCHGVFWCTIKSDAKHDLPLLVGDFVKIIGSNFTQVEIDGFDELFSRDLWKMHENAESFRETARSTVGSTQTQSFETQTLTPQQTEELEWSTVSARILKYCETLRIRFPVHPDSAWLTEQLHNLNLAAFDDEHRSCVTRAGYLLFGKHPQDIVHSGRIRLTVRGTARWLARVGNDGWDEMAADSAALESIERTIEGNLWSQYDQVNDILSAFNRPFRLKGEFSENVMPYPPLSLKEIVVNALVHRDYGRDELVEIEIEPTRIRIINPGGLVEEVRRSVENESIEEEIKRGARGIKGYRNPVLADLFYGGGVMDKRGSGLADVYKAVRENGGEVRFGANEDNSNFIVEIFCRPEAVDEITGTASPLVLTTSRYAGNILEVTETPAELFHATSTCRNLSEIWAELPDQNMPPFLFLGDRIYSFYELDSRYNPLRHVIDKGTVEDFSFEEFVSLEDGERRMIWLLNLTLERHFYELGLITDKKRKRAYFPRSEEGSVAMKYQARLKRATRTVVKPRVSPHTGVVTYWEHQSVSYRFEWLGDIIGLFLEPGYVFTSDGRKKLLAPERVNRLSTKRASRDYNNAVHNDLTFWSRTISGGEDAYFDLNPGRFGERSNGSQDGTTAKKSLGLEEFMRSAAITLASRLPTVTTVDAALPRDAEEFDESSDDDFQELDSELIELAESHGEGTSNGYQD
jgi:predicted HTH transcriptional regulator